MAASSMKLIQVYLRPEQIEPLRWLARRRGVPIAELIRQGVDHILVDASPEEDSLWNISGIIDSGLADLAENHDKYIAKMVAQENRD